MKSLVESILSSTGIGAKAMLEKIFAKHNSNVKFDVKGNHIIFKAVKRLELEIKDGNLYLVNNFGRDKKVTDKIPEIFVFDNLYALSIEYFGGPLPKCLYGCNIKNKGYNVEDDYVNIYVNSSDVSGNEMSNFLDELLKNTNIENILLNIKNNYSIRYCDLTNHDYGKRNVCIFHYSIAENPKDAIPFYTIKGMKCNIFTVGYSNRDYVAFENTDKIRKYLGLGIWDDTLSLFDDKHWYDDPYFQVKIKEFANNNEITHLNFYGTGPTNINLFYSEKLNKYIEMKVKSDEKRLGKLQK